MCVVLNLASHPRCCKYWWFITVSSWVLPHFMDDGRHCLSSHQLNVWFVSSLGRSLEFLTDTSLFLWPDEMATFLAPHVCVCLPVWQSFSTDSTPLNLGNPRIVQNQFWWWEWVVVPRQGLVVWCERLFAAQRPRSLDVPRDSLHGLGSGFHREGQHLFFFFN